MITDLIENGYSISDYKNCKSKKKTVILRHDIDTDISKAVRMAKIESDLSVSSTYFVLLTSQFYNLMAKDTLEELKKIKNRYGHNIGLHFDELNYTNEYYKNNGGIKNTILTECEILKTITGFEIDYVSMHRPSRETLTADYDLSPAINSYSSYFFKEFKYVSDSRRQWREDIDEIIKSGRYDKLHILTHAFWYNDIEENIETTISKFINNGNMNRYDILNKNITNLDTIVERKEIMEEQ